MRYINAVRSLGQVMPIITPVGDDPQCITQIQQELNSKNVFPGVYSFNIDGTWNDATMASLDTVYGSRNAWRNIGNACQIKDSLVSLNFNPNVASSGYTPNISEGQRGHTAQPVPGGPGGPPAGPGTPPPPGRRPLQWYEDPNVLLVGAAGIAAVLLLTKKS